MGEYLTAACSACRQASYLHARVFRAPTWSCPACGAQNSSRDVKPPVDLGLAAPSRFGRRSSNGAAAQATGAKRSIWARLVS
jgi:hypothetical protein